MNIEKIKTWLFIAYEMYVKGRSREEVDALNGFDLVMEMDDYNSWVRKEQLEY